MKPTAKVRFRQPTVDEQQILIHLVVAPIPPDEVQRFDQLLLAQHHYLKDAQLVGEHLRYVATYRGQWLALAAWNAAALHLKARDQFVGWTDEQRRTHLPLLANNSRLLVLPACQCPNLISRFMKLMLGRLSADWQQNWGHPVALAETFVDPHLYQGTAYKASGWHRLGQTAGWKRSAEDFYQQHERPKQIWVRELLPHERWAFAPTNTPGAFVVQARAPSSGCCRRSMPPRWNGPCCYGRTRCWELRRTSWASWAAKRCVTRTSNWSAPWTATAAGWARSLAKNAATRFPLRGNC